ncbi:hypothetical protein [Variovorax saccharolyticus]|uniref:hypothetical protein n=1 Tax=Variovorax saccharolyticus TaxID=3053516 RepID=UPI0025753E1D|nr:MULTISPECIES: hypothetical protein [unclassified Variovorax]MDM0019649.1 hypothetical protein [Variovorax sp. J22R187]MDM0027801.1 hypothetical protein [Variovorax sp. J31P216]
MTVDLQTEFQTYCARLPEMLTKHDGQFVVIRGADPVHYARTYEGALDWAYQKFGLERFFVKKVTEDLAAAHFTRDLG